jgi:hypothetical protein
MIILHINSKSNNAHLFNKYVEEGKQIFVIFYMEGCGPCNATRPEWKKIENVMANLKNDNVVIVDLDQEVLEEIENLQSKPVGYPTIRYISNKGKISEDYNGERNIDAFVSWIKSKFINSKITKDNKFYGKKNRKTRNSKKFRKSRKSRKSRKNKIKY